MEEKGIDALLSSHPFFEGLDPRTLKLLAGCAKNVRFEPGEPILREGTEANEFYAIRHGRVAVEVRAPERGPIIVQTLEEGDVLGWSWLFPPYRWRFDARASALVRAVQFDGACLRRKCEENPAVGYEILKRFTNILVERLDATRLQLLDIYGKKPGP